MGEPSPTVFLHRAAYKIHKNKVEHTPTRYYVSIEPILSTLSSSEDILIHYHESLKLIVLPSGKERERRKMATKPSGPG